MTTPAMMKNIGAFVRGLFAFANLAVVAGASEDGVVQTGVTIDREDFSSLFLSGTLMVNADVTIATANTVTLRARFEDSADDSAWLAYQAEPKGDPADVVISATDTSVEEFHVNLAGARRYVRCLLTATLSEADTDDVNLSAVLVVGGSAEVPMT